MSLPRVIDPPVLIGLFGLLLVTSACGIPSGSQASLDGSPRWEGKITLATQCPYGMISETVSGPLALAGCPVSGPALIVEELSGPILFSGDCREKILAIRTADLRLDSLWQVTPDDRFDLSTAPIWIRLSHDQDGHKSCWTPARLSVAGALECQDQDRMTIRFDEFALQLASSNLDPNLNLLGPAGERCHFSPSCQLMGAFSLGQCISH